MKPYIFTKSNGFGSVTNSEIEKGESVILPNGDTYRFDTNKTHKQGGEEVMLTQKSKVLSEKIKLPKEVVFQLIGKNKKMSPASISKMFPTDKYKSILESPYKRYDNLAKKTAELNLNKNKAMQESLFQAQELYKESKNIKDNNSSKFQPGGYYGYYEDYRNLYNEKDTQRVYDNNYIVEMNLPNIDSLNDSINNRLGDISIDNQGRRYQTVFTDSTNPYFTDNTYHSSALLTGKSTFLGDNSNLFNQENYLQNQRKNRVSNKFSGQLDDEVKLLEQEYLKRVSPDRVPDINIPTYLDRKGRGYNEDNQDQILTIMRKLEDQINPLKKQISNLNPVTRELPANFKSPIVSEKNINNESYDYDDQFYNESQTREIEKSIDYRQLINGVQQGLLLSQLATLERENPYHTYTPLKTVNRRFEPINTKQAERAYNLVKESLDNTNLPSSIKQARLSQMQAQIGNQINHVDITNYQGDLQNDNQNAQNLINTVNQNNIGRTRSNYQYLTENARSRELFNQQRASFTKNALDNWRQSREQDLNIKLLNQLSRNYNFNTRDGVQYEAGQGVNSSLSGNPLSGFSKSADLNELTPEDRSKFKLSILQKQYGLK